jgi:P27 family predicted phage terminase small subunit
MGRRGPPPEPTKLRVLKGNPGKRPVNEREPQPRATSPRCPEWLSAEAKRVWQRLVPELKAMRVLTYIDGDALAAYCQTFARWRAAEEFIQKHGEAYPLRDDQGRIKCMQQFPQVAISRNLLLVLRAYQQEFGMTPSARSRVAVAPDPDTRGDAHRWLG